MVGDQVVATGVNEKGEQDSEGLKTCDPNGRPTVLKRKISLPDGWQSFKPESEVVVTLAGKDVEYWGGNFGTRFSSEKLFL